VLVTVDNGIASLEGVAHARALGLQVLVTDHHLPAKEGDQVRCPRPTSSSTPTSRAAASRARRWPVWA
jgi:single-stranded DNA-specific DHH superfamily exonuclease